MQFPPILLRRAVVAFLPLALGCSALAQSAATDPVGFVTINIPGTGGTVENTVSFKSLALTQPVEYQGAAEVVNVGAKTITDNDANWSTGQFNNGYYVEIVRPVGQATPVAGEGTTYDILSTDAASKTITTVQPLAIGLSAGAVFKIRKHWTIRAVFGSANSAGLASGADAATADEIQLWTGSSFATFYYQNLPANQGGTGWRSADDQFADAGGAVIYPDDGLVITRIQSASVDLVVMGAAKMGQTSFPISTGTNVVPNVYAVPMTLQSCGILNSGFTAGTDAATGDQILIWNGTGYAAYYFQTLPTNQGGTGWRSANDQFADVGSTVIPVGTSIVVNRVVGGAFNWVIPQHPTTL